MVDNGSENVSGAQQNKYLSSSRRTFLRTATGVAGLTTFGTVGLASGKSENPFTLGVASGDPLPDSVVLWTRLAPKPLQADGGMEDQKVEVEWKIATSEDMRHVVKEGTTYARPEHAHSVHVTPTGLTPNTEYYYQFRVDGDTSPVGRTKTAPAADASIDTLDFAFVSCQNYPYGYYTSHQHLAQEDLDVAFHLGDYIYEGGAEGPLGRDHEPPKEIKSLSDYRIRHAQYKTDSNLQNVHAAFPWIVTWDDHEVANNYADEIDEGTPPKEFLERRADAYQAYWEHQPIRRSRMPDGPDMPLYRRFTFGQLAEFNVLDTRQYRDDQTSSSKQAKSPERTILGDEQEQWLLDGLGDSTSQWNVLANQVPLGATDEDPDPDATDFGGGDKWDGYRADRTTLLEFMSDHPDLNPIVITGDVHRNHAYDLKADFSNPDSTTVGTEYVGTSMSSFGDGNGVTVYDGGANTPWEHFYNNNRGYVRCTLTPEKCRTDYRVVSTVEKQTASIDTIASFVTKAGDPGAKLISKPDPYPDTDYSDYQLVPQSQMSATATSSHEGLEAPKAIDGYTDTKWHSEYGPNPGDDAQLPQSITLDLGKQYNVKTLIYVPRIRGNNGIVTKYNIHVSSDGKSFTKVASGSWPMNHATKTATVTPPQRARYVRLEVVDGNDGFASAAEINIAYDSS